MARLGRFELSFKDREDIINGKLFNIFNGMVVISVEDDRWSKIHYYIGIDDSFDDIVMDIDLAPSASGKIPLYKFNIDTTEESESLVWTKVHGK
jgi:hypothetical protein